MRSRKKTQDSNWIFGASIASAKKGQGPTYAQQAFSILTKEGFREHIVENYACTPNLTFPFSKTVLEIKFSIVGDLMSSKNGDKIIALVS